MSGNAVNKLPEPLSWTWSVSNVIDWVHYGLKLPQYIVIFKENNIDGKKLIFVNCRKLPSMGITDFNHIKYIAKNVRRLYGLSPDNVRGHNDPSGRRASVHDVYGRYYTHLAGAQPRGHGRLMTLFDYMRSVGLVVHGRATDRQMSVTTAADAAAEWCSRPGTPSSWPSPPAPPRDVVVLARLPATEYLRGGQCAHADRAVVRFDAPVARVQWPVTAVRRRGPRCNDDDDDATTRVSGDSPRT